VLRGARPLLPAVALLVGTALPAAHSQAPPAGGPPAVAPAPNVCLAGTGSFGWCGDGGAATRAKLARPHDVALAPDGSLIVADTANQVIRRVDPDGTIATIAGTGARGPAVSTRAGSARFAEPSGVAIDQDGSVLVADTGNDALRRIGVDGRVTTVVGQRLSGPTDVVVLGNGAYAVADTGNHRVIRVSARGGITALAGTRVHGLSGDGGPATGARLDSPTQLALSAAGLLIADTGNGVVRRVGADGMIATIAGRRSGAGSGTTPANRLELLEPRGVAAMPDGGIAISDAGRVWAVAADGAVAPLAGTGRPGFSGDRGAALSTRLDGVGQLALTPGGAIVLADSENDRLREVFTSGEARTIAGSDRPDVELAPVVTAPFLPRQATPPRKTYKYRSRRHSGVISFVTPQSVSGGGAPRRAKPSCATAATNYNWLKIRPFTKRLIFSTSRPVIIRFGTSVDAKVTSFAWRSGHRFGRRTVRIAAGRRSIRLRGTLRPGRYVAVIEGSDPKGARRCDSRSLKIMR
jgi:sugar lactone lactonase YvrE